MRWVKTGYLRKPDRTFEYTLDLPWFLAQWDVWDYWERERIHSMRDHLNTSDVLVDVGAESGWMTLVFADMVGPGNMIVVEPCAEYWPNIRQTWERRFDVPPLTTYCGLLGSAPADNQGHVYNQRWCPESIGPLSPARAYEYLHNGKTDVAVQTLDYFGAVPTGVVTAVTMDVEGAELEVLKGAVALLDEVHPKLWISVHPDLMARDYNTTPDELTRFLRDFGYTGTHLATDHEEHWMFL